MATQGQYIGETVLGTIGEDVGLGQVLYLKSAPLGTTLTHGVWYAASADGDYVSPTGYVAGQFQLGIATEAATASTISSTQSGTQIPILLRGYYSPGVAPAGSFGGYCNGNLQPGAPMWLMPGTIHSDPTNYKGCIDGEKPTTYGATHGVFRLIGYCYDEQSPFIIRFDPDLTWIEF